jgi:hypothetical protein
MLVVIAVVIGCSKSITDNDVCETTFSGETSSMNMIEQVWILQISREEFERDYSLKYYQDIEKLYEENGGFMELDVINDFVNQNYGNIFKQYEGELPTNMSRNIVGARTCCSSNQYCALPCKCKERYPNPPGHKCWKTVESDKSFTPEDQD